MRVQGLGLCAIPGKAQKEHRVSHTGLWGDVTGLGVLDSIPKNGESKLKKARKSEMEAGLLWAVYRGDVL